MTKNEWDILCYRRARLNHKLQQLSAVEDMVDAYLYDKGLSGFLSDDLYFPAYALLDKA